LVPVNDHGVQDDHTPQLNSSLATNSTGYIGLSIHPWNTGVNANRREYVTNNFPIELSAGTTYTIEFWVSLADVSLWATKLSAWIGRPEDLPSSYSTTGPINFPAATGPTDSYFRYNSPIINNSQPNTQSNWSLQTFNFTPTKSGNYNLIIGNMNLWNSVAYAAANPYTNPSPYSVPAYGRQNISYYFIDDISITPACIAADYSFVDECENHNALNTDIYWSSFGFPNPIPIGSTIYVNGNLHVDLDVNLNFADMNFSPNSTLIVDAGKNLNIRFSSLRGCPDMWNGILSSSATSSITLFSSNVYDAKQAIDGQNNVVVNLKQNIFENNLNGIKLSNFTGAWNLVYQGNRIRCNSILKLPLSIFHSSVGIEVNNIGYVNLSQAGLPNYYTDLQIGMLIINTDCNISNQRINGTGLPTNFGDLYNYGISCNSFGGQLHFVHLSNGSGATIINNIANGIRFFGNFYNQVENC